MNTKEKIIEVLERQGKMKEDEFLERINKSFETLSIKVGIFYALDEEGNVVFDEESTRRAFENEIESIKNILK